MLPEATESIFGEFGLQSTEGGWVSAATIEAGPYCRAAIYSR